MSMTVEKTILEQLGGARFTVMTGARNFVAGNGTLSFRLPGNITKKGINAMRVTLTPADLYTVEALKIRGTKVSTVETREAVYFDSLRAVFEAITGLRTSL